MTQPVAGTRRRVYSGPLRSPSSERRAETPLSSRNARADRTASLTHEPSRPCGSRCAHHGRPPRGPPAYALSTLATALRPSRRIPAQRNHRAPNRLEARRHSVCVPSPLHSNGTRTAVVRVAALSQRRRRRVYAVRRRHRCIVVDCERVRRFRLRTSTTLNPPHPHGAYTVHARCMHGACVVDTIARHTRGRKHSCVTEFPATDDMLPSMVSPAGSCATNVGHACQIRALAQRCAARHEMQRVPIAVCLAEFLHSIRPRVHVAATSISGPPLCTEAAAALPVEHRGT